MKSRHTCITYVAKSKTEPQGDANHTLRSRHASVWNFYDFLIQNISGTPLNHESLFLMSASYLKVWAIFISFFSFFFSFLHALWHAFFLSFMPFGMNILFYFFVFPLFLA
jgi:hypothetical protein